VISQLSVDAGISTRCKTRIFLKCFRECPVEAAAFARQQLIMRSLLEQCMPESVAVAIGVGNQGAALHRGTQTCLQLVLAKLCNDLQKLVIDSAPGSSRDPQHPPGRIGQLVQAGGQDVAKARRHPSLRRVSSGKQLLDIERVCPRSGR
jgi:hypothetical protein